MAGSRKEMTPKQRAIADLEAARATLGGQLHGAANRFRPAVLLQENIRRHRIWWALGAAAVGLLAARLLVPSLRDAKNSGDTVVKSAKTGGILALLAAPVLGVARKAIVSWFLKQAPQILQSPFFSPRSHHP
jgi:hypothetical protein